MEADPIANSVAWVLVADETKNFCDIDLPVAIKFEISLLEKALSGMKNGKGVLWANGG